MSIPNKTKKWLECLLFQCECGGLNHLMQLWYDKTGDDITDGLNILMIHREPSLFKTILEWFKKRHVWFAECIISKDDCVAMRDKLDEYIKDVEKYEKKLKEKNK